ncbi:hypothetical protein [Salinicoccus halitifaciens]
MNELATMMFACSIFFTLLVAPDLFAEMIADNPESLYVGYIAIVGSQQNLAFISLGVGVIIFSSFFTKNYTLRIMTNIAGITYTTFITASYVFDYPNLVLGLLVVMIIWQIHETYQLIDESEDEKAKKILVNSLKEN